jgi:glycosyltransferase involved in cell wall biosynthesis
MIMLDLVFSSAPQFDVIHFHGDALHYPLARRCPTPSLTTLHGRLDTPDLQLLHRHFTSHPVVSISSQQRKTMWNANWLDTVHHGLPLDQYDFYPSAGDYFAFLGRISPEKRVDRAIEIAIACDTRLLIAAKVDPYDQRYFEDEIKPLLDHPLIEFVGEIGDRQKNDFLGHAKALLFPIDWPEPFGLVMIEALAAGTPVIAYGHGAVPEIIEHGATGFIVASQLEAIAAARAVGAIERSQCRADFEQRFTATIMASRYVELYTRLVAMRSPLDAANARLDSMDEV